MPTKIEIYKSWVEKDFEGVSRESMKDAIKTLIASRDHWKIKSLEKGSENPGTEQIINDLLNLGRNK